MDNNHIIYDSQALKYKSIFGAIKIDTSFLINIEICNTKNIRNVFLHLIDKNNIDKKMPMEFKKVVDFYNVYSIDLKTPNEAQLLFYYFEIEFEEFRVFYGNNEEELGGMGKIYEVNPKKYQISVYEDIYDIPSWYQNGIMYQIFVDRFNKVKSENTTLKDDILIYANWYDNPSYLKNEKGDIKKWDYFGGNLEGVIQKLDYLKSLNINIIYFNPIFEAHSNHKYDTADYKKLDSMFGNEEVFKKLIEECEKRDIKIILDGVFSHTGSDSIYFNREGKYSEIGAYESKESKYFDWYKFKDYPDEYESWWGVKTLPEINELTDSYLDYIIRDDDSVIKHWLKKGVSGYRLDVADELPDKFIEILKKHMKEYKKDSILIGEVWEDASNKEAYGELRKYFYGKELDGVMNYPFKDIIIDFLMNRIDANKMSKLFFKYMENYPIKNLYSNMNMVSSHDIPRILTILGESPHENNLCNMDKESYRLDFDKLELGMKRVKLISLMQMTFYGIPCLYYGDEAGLEGYSDPYNRRTYPWGKENQILLNWYKKITFLRNKYKALSNGFFKLLYAKDNIYIYQRYIDHLDVYNNKSQKQNLIIAINRSDNEEHVELNICDIKTNNYKNILNNYCDEIYHIKNNKIHLNLKAYEGKVLLGY